MSQPRDADAHLCTDTSSVTQRLVTKQHLGVHLAVRRAHTGLPHCSKAEASLRRDLADRTFQSGHSSPPFAWGNAESHQAGDHQLPHQTVGKPVAKGQCPKARAGGWPHPKAEAPALQPGGQEVGTHLPCPGPHCHTQQPERQSERERPGRWLVPWAVCSPHPSPSVSSVPACARLTESGEIPSHHRTRKKAPPAVRKLTRGGQDPCPRSHCRGGRPRDGPCRQGLSEEPESRGNRPPPYTHRGSRQRPPPSPSSRATQPGGRDAR